MVLLGNYKARPEPYMAEGWRLSSGQVEKRLPDLPVEVVVLCRPNHSEADQQASRGGAIF